MEQTELEKREQTIDKIQKYLDDWYEKNWANWPKIGYVPRWAFIALYNLIEQEKRKAFEAAREVQWEDFDLPFNKYPTYESYSLKKGEEETERGLG